MTVISLVGIGIAFVPTGTYLISSSNNLYEHTIVYDGSSMDLDCSISTSNEGRNCNVLVTLDEDVSGPLHVYYELRNFYQNQRAYVASLNYEQLQGTVSSQGSVCFSEC
jgi:hypothetical protein